MFGKNLRRGGRKTLRPPLHSCKKSRIMTRASRAHNKILYYSLAGERLRERERERVIKFSRPPKVKATFFASLTYFICPCLVIILGVVVIGG